MLARRVALTTSILILAGCPTDSAGELDGGESSSSTTAATSDPEPSSDVGTTTTTSGSTSQDSGSTSETGTTSGSSTSGETGSASTGAVDPCIEDDPCLNGTCSSREDVATCECEEPWTGEFCGVCAEGYVEQDGECVAAASCEKESCGDGACSVVENAVVCTLVFEHTAAAQQWTVPPEVSSIDVEALGASGGCDLGGLGGFASASLAVAGGDSIAVMVGGTGACGLFASLPGGFNGGGDKFTDSGDFWSGGSGGGASDIRSGDSGLESRRLVAGGGGGRGFGGAGGAGGGESGESADGVGGGCDTMLSACGGRGGTQDEGGIGGVCVKDCEGVAGTLGQGGTSDGCAAAGGGGGGGYYGGGGGAHCSGGGGSSRTDFAGNTNTEMTPGVHTGDGEITIVWRP